MDIRRARIRCLSKLSDIQLQENCEQIADHINAFPVIRRDNIIVDNNIDNLTAGENTYTELYRLHRDKAKTKVKHLYKEYNSNYLSKEALGPQECSQPSYIFYKIVFRAKN